MRGFASSFEEVGTTQYDVGTARLCGCSGMRGFLMPVPTFGDLGVCDWVGGVPEALVHLVYWGGSAILIWLEKDTMRHMDASASPSS